MARLKFINSEQRSIELTDNLDRQALRVLARELDISEEKLVGPQPLSLARRVLDQINRRTNGMRKQKYTFVWLCPICGTWWRDGLKFGLTPFDICKDVIARHVELKPNCLGTDLLYGRDQEEVLQKYLKLKNGGKP